MINVDDIKYTTEDCFEPDGGIFNPCSEIRMKHEPKQDFGTKYGSMEEEMIELESIEFIDDGSGWEQFTRSPFDNIEKMADTREHFTVSI